MKIYKQMSLVMSEVEAIEKLRKNNQGTGYAFRGIDDVYAAMNAPLVKHGVFCIPNVTSQIREERRSQSGGVLNYSILTVEFHFYADDGSHVKATTVGEAFDSGDKSSSKAMSSAMKYAMLQTFCIPTSDPKDVENDSPDVAPKEKKSAEKEEIPDFAPPKGDGGKPISEKQRTRLFAICKTSGLPDEELKKHIAKFGYDSTAKIGWKNYEAICKFAENYRA